MDKNIIEQYKQEMLKMYSKTKAVPTVAEISPQQPKDTSQGELIGLVTTIRSLYPVSGAKVTVFTGNPNEMTVIDSDFTDTSGRTKSFVLPTPDKNLSQFSGVSEKPYASYNMLVQADGYVDNIHLNIPVFSGITSLQSSNLMLAETAGVNKGPQIFDESQQFNL